MSVLIAIAHATERETALRANMRETREPVWVVLLKRVRRLIETVIGNEWNAVDL